LGVLAPHHTHYGGLQDRLGGVLRSRVMDADPLVAEFHRNARAFVESAERNPWTHELRAVLAEADRTGDRRPIDDFVARFKKHLFKRWGPPR
jgi:hypothetical protein